ncbi:MAG TPA: hypothetical protein VMB03_33930 [Bryobacteraceae bacterium]|nr:hypothetical protein [Bryobacteraceae bacterium]
MKRCAYSLVFVVSLLILYSNHFRNDFQFDDTKAIPQNPAIRQPGTILRAFVDPTLFSAAPEQRTYRPVTTASLALDYWLAGGLNVFFFHLSTFVWFSLQVVLMFVLFERLMDAADPHPSNVWVALAAAAVYGYHPANAETINYIIQRSEVYNALGSIASLYLFIRYPSQRKFGWYLAPAALAMLAKPPALIFPLLLAGYVLLFELGGTPPRGKWRFVSGAVTPSLALAAAMAFLLKRMQPARWNPGALSPGAYRVTQPYVALHYFKSFFLPTSLNVDPGWHSVRPWSVEAIAGYLFILVLLVSLAASRRFRAAKPIAFGIIWFLATLLPTSLMPLRDITNDHRMFFSFVGLSLAVIWGVRLALFRATAGLTRNPGLVPAAVTALTVLLVVAGIATRVRNRVWLTEASLWSDSVAKNPRNPRALSNYAAVAYEEGDYDTALRYWQRTLAVDPAFPAAQTSIAIAAAKLHRDDLAEQYLRNLVDKHPSDAVAYSSYADWLQSVGRFDDALPLLDRARELNPISEELKRQRTSLLLKRDSADRILLFQTLDADRDGTLSAGEMIAAPAALLSLDRNGDGKLTKEECGADIRSNPLLRALDSDHDGEISAAEMRGAERALEKLDRDGDGVVDTAETVPDYVRNAGHHIFEQLDVTHSGRVGVTESGSDTMGAFLMDADIDGDGYVTPDELINELFYRADRDKDGTVTKGELAAAVDSIAPKFRDLRGHQFRERAESVSERGSPRLTWARRRP